MSKYTLYAVEWKPSGTNDLLVVDSSSSQIVACIEDALFGFKRTGFWNSTLRTTKAVEGEEVICLSNADEYDPQAMAMLGRISKRDVLKYLACSPVDPTGGQTLLELQKWGVASKRQIRRSA